MGKKPGERSSCTIPWPSGARSRRSSWGSPPRRRAWRTLDPEIEFPNAVDGAKSVIAVSTDGGVCPKVLNGDEPAPALVVLEQLEVEPDAQGEVGHLDPAAVQQPGAADGVGIGVSQADLKQIDGLKQMRTVYLKI